MKKELEEALRKLEEAFRALKEGAAEAESQLEKDGVIQRFEFTFEVFWKAIKIFLEHKGVIVKVPRDTFQEAFRLDWLSDEELFLNMLEDRNRTSHIYGKKMAETILGRIKEDYVRGIETGLNKLKSL